MDGLNASTLSITSIFWISLAMTMFLQSSVSGLQRLFSTASSSLSPHTPRAQRQLESVTEEAHTYDLLYPEGETLKQGQHHAYPLKHGDPVSIAAAANSSDDRGGLDIQSPRDVRIIIAQNANVLSPQPRIMYDSHPVISLPYARNGSSLETNESSRPRGGSLTGGHRRNSTNQRSHTAPHSRQSSISQTAQSIFNAPSSPLSPVSELGGLFGGVKTRHNLRPATSDGETIQSKLAREEREETENLVECMFGAAGFPSVSSTKLHVRPPKQTDAENNFRPSSAREPASPGADPKRRTPLTRSTTAADLHSLSTSVSDDAPQQSSRFNTSSILITRLFSVDPTDSDSAPKSPNGSHSLGSDDHTRGTGPSKGKAEQSKSPTYAVAVLLSMPVHRPRLSTPSLGRFSGYSAISPHSWSSEGPQRLSLLGTDTSSNTDYVIAHWTMLIRALSCLEVAARYEIGNLLGEIETPLLARPTNGATSASETEPNIKVGKLKQPTRRTLQLSVGALQNRPSIRKLSEKTATRIALALRIRKVVAGQGRWGVWREEARWVGKWAGGKEQNFFLFNLLTAFLGSHTEWLDSLGPSRYKRRHAKQSHNSYSEINSIQHRTVVVSQDKMAARRLIFLLSAFLPSAYIGFQADGNNQLEASWSNMAYSQSPPSAFPINRQRSLRRTMNRRTGPRRASPHTTSHARSVSFSDAELFANDDNPAEDQSTQQRARRASDARSIRNAALPISFNGSDTRKSSTTTTATVVPDTAIGIPHFSGYSATRPLGTAAGPRPGSSGSLVSLSLRRTLSRSESSEKVATGSDSQSMSRWGSMISGFWSDRRTSSTEGSDPLASSEEGLGISGISNGARGSRVATTLTEMVKEVDMQKNALTTGQGNSNTTSSSLTATQLPHDDREPEEILPSRSTAPRRFRESFPLKLSIDEDDGVVDVDLPPANSYPSSFESIASSPIAIRSAASSFNGRSSFHGRTSVHASPYSSPDTSIDVTGWLRNYHADFALQAVRPYDSLKEDIKRSMRTEPSPTAPVVAHNEDDGYSEEWVDVCTTLLADTTTFTVTRLCLRRRNPASTHHQVDALLNLDPTDYAEQEEIIEEPLMDMDPTLIDAVEKVLGHSGHSSRVPSRAPSRAPSPTRQNGPTSYEGSPDLEVPRSECKRMVLGALEQVARSVSAELSKGKNVDVQRLGRDNFPTDSTLREGVRRWLSQVDREGR